MRDKSRYVPGMSRRDTLRGLGTLALGLGAGGFERRGANANAAAPIAVTGSQSALAPHRFRVGSFEVVTVPDGSVTFPNAIFPLPPAQLLFVNADEAERSVALEDAGLGDWIEAAETANVTLPVLPMVVDTGTQRVLFDTGYGAASPVPTGGQLLVNLRAAGIDPAEIDVVVLSHLHPDHILGASDGSGEPAFANARYVTGRSEHDFWTDDARVEAAFPDPGERAGLLGPLQATLPAIEARLELVDDLAEEEIVPGIRAVAAPGHSPGHMAVTIASGSEQVLAVFDAFIHPLHVAHPDWSFVGDADPDQTEATRRALVDRIEAEEMAVIAYHFPYPGLGRVLRQGDAWTWEPAVEP